MKKRILIYGGGAHAQYTIDIIEKENKYKIIGITDPYKKVGSIVYEYPILGKQEQIVELIKQYNIQGGIISIGDNFTRSYVYDIIKKLVPNFEFVNAIHPSTVIGKNVKLGVGLIIMAGCIINPGCKISDFCFFATGAQLDHDSFMGVFSSISAGSITGGNVKIGAYSAITLGVIVMDRISIGENTVIGSGALVTKDLPDNVLAYGVPAKIIRNREKGEKFLKSGIS